MTTIAHRTMNAHNLSIAALSPKTESRFNIAGIHVTPQYTEVTDGHLLMRVACPDIPVEQFPDLSGMQLTANDGHAILSTESALELAKALVKQKSTIPVLATAALYQNGAVDENGKALRYVVCTDLETVTKKAVETKGNFPEIDRVLQGTGPEDADFAIAFDANLLAKLLGQIAKMGNKKGVQGVVIYGRKPTVHNGHVDSRAVRFEAVTTEGQTVTALAMGVRAEAHDDFWRAKLAPATEAEVA